SSPRNRRRRFTKFRQPGSSLALRSGLHVDLYALACRVATLGRIFWKVLSLQRCVARRSRPALAGDRRALRQFRFALLLPDCAEIRLRRKIARGPSFTRASSLRHECYDRDFGRGYSLFRAAATNFGRPDSQFAALKNFPFDENNA